ncbi:hypothetical protein [Cohaesibacter gelatinilyticus]|uniref:Uncharacterized protein n=1 Tax=Cohaesibacter gelatinilyticus TaxID=372072 RepID=A0A285NGZ7_9HYPH|nr:hypothetical protein [Cohaesibacter gelatinilyticus]SNZ08548.1 hypothetical protein SAMN06265368_1724 [Cohaesibacter gelatinilyticus]
MKILAIAAFVSVLSVSSTLAGTVNKTVPANQSTVLTGISLFNSMNCNHGPIPKVKLKSPPKHGKVTFKKKVIKISSGRCKGKTMTGTLVIYTPKRGYRGQDAFKSEFSYDKYVTGSTARAYNSDTFKLTVK